MIATAKGRFLRVAPRKARLVVDLIRGKYTDEALSTLQFTPKRASKTVEKLLKSAIANAEQRADVNVDNLFISKATVDGGPALKRLVMAASRSDFVQPGGRSTSASSA